MKALVTGFEPFGNSSLNSSWQAVSLLPDNIDNCTIIKGTIPVVFNKVEEHIVSLIKTEKPDIVLMVGQRGGSSTIDCERFAVNLEDSEKPDNEYFIPKEEPIQKDGPIAYFTSLPIKNIVDNLNNEGIPAHISNSAGTYVCNCLLYHAIHYCTTHKLDTKVGFIHLPNLPQQVIGKLRAPSMPTTLTVQALTIALRTVINK